MKSTITLTDREAVDMFLGGKQQGLEVLITKYKSKIYTSIFMLVKDEHLAEDIFQDSFIKIIENLRSGKYNEENKFIQWAMRIAHNLCMDHFRKAKSSTTIKNTEVKDAYDGIAYDGLNTEQKMLKNQTNSEVMEIVAMLPQEQQEIIILRHFADLKFKEIADILKCSVNTALGRMRYALVNLRKLVEEKELTYN